MIYDTLDNADTYNSLHPKFAEAFDFLRNFDPATPEGEIEIDGTILYASVQHYTTLPVSKCRYEAHQDYLDIQVIYSGSEAIYTSPLNRLDVTEPYVAAHDVTMLDGTDHQFVDLAPREFAIFLPQDGHKPRCQSNGPVDVVKVVIKLKLES